MFCSFQPQVPRFATLVFLLLAALSFTGCEPGKSGKIPEIYYQFSGTVKDNFLADGPCGLSADSLYGDFNMTFSWTPDETLPQLVDKITLTMVMTWNLEYEVCIKKYATLAGAGDPCQNDQAFLIETGDPTSRSFQVNYNVTLVPKETSCTSSTSTYDGGLIVILDQVIPQAGDYSLHVENVQGTKDGKEFRIAPL